MKQRILHILISAVVLIAAVVIGLSTIHAPSSDPSGDMGGIQGDEGRYEEIVCHNEAEYIEFIETSKILPSNFITMDMLKDFGSFDGFVWVPELGKSYSYGVLLENDHNMVIIITHNPEIKTKNYLDISQVGKTMREINTTEKGAVVSNGMEYYYVPDGLISVSWMVNGVEIMLCWNDRLENAPPLSENHILNKIFSKSSDDQIAALNQLKAKMEIN